MKFLREAILLGLGIVVLAALIVLVIPKHSFVERDDGFTHCSCLGSKLWFGAECLGFPVDCEEVVVEKEVSSCSDLSCADMLARIRDDAARFGKNSSQGILSGTGGTDVLLVMDASNSMEGDKLLAAKRAALRLISGLQENERIGVVSFSEHTAVVHGFSDDKRSLTEAVNGLTVSGGTKYLPALELSDELFGNVTLNTRKGIIFLSDGVPADDADAILAKSRVLYAENISLFTISFGIKASDEVNILKRMVANGDPAAVDQWYQSFSDTEDITDAFYQAYQEITNLRLIDIEPAFSRGSFAADEVSELGVSLSLNYTRLSGEPFGDALCVPGIGLNLVLSNGSHTFNYSLSPHEDVFVAEGDRLMPGVFDVDAFAHLELNHNGSCLFTGESSLGSVEVVDRSSRCVRSECDTIERALTDNSLALLEGMRVPRQGKARVFFLFDTSESMRSFADDALLAMESVDRQLEGDDSVSLITFGLSADLAVPETTDGGRVLSAARSVRFLGTTKLVPALAKVAFFRSVPGARESVVVLTDGDFYDDGGDDAVVAAANRLVDRGSCIFVVGYGSHLLRDAETSAALRGVVRSSRERNGCGGFVLSPDDEELVGLVASIIGGSLDGQPVIISSDVPSVVFFPDEAVVEVGFGSGVTGLRLPLIDKASCVPLPDLSAEVFGGRDVLALTPVLVGDGLYHVTLPVLAPGEYVLRLSAQLDGCKLVGVAEEPFVVVDAMPAKGENTIMGLVILFIVAFSVIAQQLWKLLRGRGG